jgi:SAM-dependent methyltransferase
LSDYEFLRPHVDPLAEFQRDMTAKGVPHREWHPHRFWEYASILQQMLELGVPQNGWFIDVGAGASFFDPYFARLYPNLCCTDTEKYGDYRWMVQKQREAYGVTLPLFDVPLEDMSVFGDSQFDATFCISTIEHVDDHDQAFGELVRITKPSGYIMLTSDYFRDLPHYEQSISRHLQVTPYREEFVLDLPRRFGVEFVGATDLAYRGDYIHNYSFCNICLRKL